ncbi:hypothetical protein FA95DRAFT_1567302 [Auriscalpium vulgare]|uniref:Uncharacterized protein n=1 Tax=Auriscalpium vulgare TaxID=40419 RepID=A0ACB8R523_9AGAM|nr:hypothetical protein FA95DRAFT_1567302 [Auriscalpium vulgare]
MTFSHRTTGIEISCQNAHLRWPYLSCGLQARFNGGERGGAETASYSRVRVFCEAFTAFCRSCGCGDIESRCGGQRSCDCERHLVQALDTWRAGDPFVCGYTVELVNSSSAVLCQSQHVLQ